MPEARLDRQVVGRVVAVVRRAREDRRQPQARDAQGGDVVQPGATPAQRPAADVPGRGGHRQRRAIRPGEPVDEHLVDDGVAQPVGDRLVVDVHGEGGAAGHAIGPGSRTSGVVGRVEDPAVDPPVAGPGLEPVADHRPGGLARDRARPGLDVRPREGVPARRRAVQLDGDAGRRAAPVARRVRVVERRVAGHVVGVDVGPEGDAHEDRVARARIRWARGRARATRPRRGRGAAPRGGRSWRASRTRSPARPSRSCRRPDRRARVHRRQRAGGRPATVARAPVSASTNAVPSAHGPARDGEGARRRAPPGRATTTTIACSSSVSRRNASESSPASRTWNPPDWRARDRVRSRTSARTNASCSRSQSASSHGIVRRAVARRSRPRGPPRRRTGARARRRSPAAARGPLATARGRRRAASGGAPCRGCRAGRTGSGPPPTGWPRGRRPATRRARRWSAGASRTTSGPRSRCPAPRSHARTGVANPA